MSTSPETPTPEKLSPDRFAAEFGAASRKLWCLAAATLGSRGLAEDVLQEAAMTALGRLESFVPGTNFVAWMAQIVRFTALNHARRHYRSKEFGTDVLVAPATEQGGDVGLIGCGQLSPDQQHFDDAVMRALQQLGEVPRASFLLRTLLGLSYREISELQGIPEGTAMSHVHRSRAALWCALSEDVSFELCPAWRAS